MQEQLQKHGKMLGNMPGYELSRNMHRVTMIASDHTQPVSSRLLIPMLLQEIRRGNPDAEITILIATGCHCKTSREELIDKFSEEIAARAGSLAENPNPAEAAVRENGVIIMLAKSNDGHGDEAFCRE